MTNQIMQKKEVQAFQHYLANKETLKAIQDVLPSGKKQDVERILRIALMEFANNPALHQCSLQSVGTALMRACRLGLEVGSLTGHAYLIPYRDQCTLQIGYKGLVELAYRMGFVKRITARTVFENDEFEIRGGTEDSIKHKLCLRDKGKVIGYYVVIDLHNSRPVFHYMSVDEIEDHKAKFSKGGGSFWSKFPEQMAYKTIFIKLFKWLPTNPFLQQVQEEENGGEVIEQDQAETISPKEKKPEHTDPALSILEDLESLSGEILEISDNGEEILTMRSTINHDMGEDFEKHSYEVLLNLIAEKDVSNEIVVKWLDKANVTSIRDLSDDQKGKLIIHLRDK